MSARHLVFEGVAKPFAGAQGPIEVVRPFDLTVARGEVVVFLGPSGCGKTTLMRMVGGLETPTAGRITLGGETLGRPDQRRGMVFQSYSSFPWLTVRGNVAFGLRYRRDLSPAQRRERVEHYLRVVGLTEFAEAHPTRISGGMRQRVAIARTLAAGSEVLLMDEPFGALDAQRREALQVELRRIQEEDAHTVVFVIHDVEEAAFLAGRVIVFTRRPAAVLAEVDVAARLGRHRTLETRDSETFFRLCGELLRHVRATADPGEFDLMHAVNVRGPFVLTQALLPLLCDGAQVVLVASELARLGHAGASAHAATKGAVISLTGSWAREFAPRILVNAAAPGPVDTPLLGFEAMSEAERAVETTLPLGRIGTPAEVAAVVAFLAGPECGYVTGQCFGLDGGAAMR